MRLYLVAPLLAFSAGELSAQSCSWPMRVRVDQPAEYAVNPVGTVSMGGDGGLIALNVVPSPRPAPPPPQRSLVVPHIVTTIGIMPSPLLAPDLVGVSLQSAVSLADKEQHLAEIIESTPAWREFQSHLSCEDSARDVEYHLDPQVERLLLHISFNMSHRQCHPFNIEIGKARVTADAEITPHVVRNADDDGYHLDFSVSPPKVHVDTSPEQDLILGILGGGAIFGPIGSQVGLALAPSLSSMLNSALSTPLQGIDLRDAVPLPDPSVGKIKLKVTVDRIVFIPMQNELTMLVNAHIEGGLREGTMCSWAKRQPPVVR